MSYVGHGARQWDLDIDMHAVNCWTNPIRGKRFSLMNKQFALATAHNTEVIMNLIRRILRLLDLYIHLRSYRLEMWQPQNCAVAGMNYWMPHDQEASTHDLNENSTYIGELLEA